MLIFQNSSYCFFNSDLRLDNSLISLSILQIYDQFDCQKLNIKYCKFILGVHKISSNQAVLWEHGRFPLFIYIIINLFFI
jgi:hypothetical protein